MKAKVLELTLPKLTLEEIFLAQGSNFTARPPHPRILELNQRIIAEAAALIQPKVVWLAVDVLKVDGQAIYVSGGEKFTSKLLTQAAGTADKLIVAAITLGPELETQVAAYQAAGRMSDAFALDSAGSAYIALSSPRFCDSLKKTYNSDGLMTTFPMGPGHSYWPDLREQRVIFKLLQPEAIGMQLSESNLIMPRKSVSMVIGLGRNLPELRGKTHCDFCPQHQKCAMHKVTHLNR